MLPIVADTNLSEFMIAMQVTDLQHVIDLGYTTTEIEAQTSESTFVLLAGCTFGCTKRQVDADDRLFFHRSLKFVP
jgi:hypothetical protein